MHGTVGGSTRVVWSSKFAAYLGTAGAAVGLGSIWRFPYLAGTSGGSAFILVFVIACLFIATPLLAAEFSLGRGSRLSPPYAAGVIAIDAGLSSCWNAIGILGSTAAFLIFSYYAVVASWVLAYSWKCAAGVLTRAGVHHVSALWTDFLSNPLEAAEWHAAFVILVIVISGRGLRLGVEVANRIRAPALLILLLGLVIYSLCVGDVRHGLTFAFAPNFSAISPQVVLSAIGQAFYATGVGQAMMIAYGAYVERGTSLVYTSLVITGSILLVSLLATVMIFPLVFGYGMNPAQGPELVFEVLPRAFTEMPGGRVFGSLFFVLLVLAALMPSIALLEPLVAWLVERHHMGRMWCVSLVAGSAWVLGLGSVFSFNLWSSFHPLTIVPALADKTVFGAIDYISSNIMLPIGALLTSVFVGWRLRAAFINGELSETSPPVRTACIWLLRYICPLGILAVFIANLI